MSGEGPKHRAEPSHLDNLIAAGHLPDPDAPKEPPRQFPRPRIDIEIKREIVRAIIAADSELAAVKVVDRLWSMLRGDMQDRITSVLDAAWGAVEAKDMNARRDGLKRALERLAPYEVAAARHIPRPQKKKDQPATRYRRRAGEESGAGSS